MSAVYLVAVLYMAAIYWASAQSGERVGRLLWFPGSDLLLHGLAYAGLSMVWYAALRRSGLRPGAAAVAAYSIAVLYGVVDEYHQSFGPGRDASWLDLVADSAGALVGIATLRLGALARRLRL